MLKLKKSLLVAIFASAGLLGISSLANAALPGFYLGGQAGWGDTHYSSSDFAGATRVKDTGIAGRIFAGYQFDQNWAAEFGYSKFSNASGKNIASISGLNATIKTQAIDLVGKGILPLQDNFNLYGKLGAAYIEADPSISYVGISSDGSAEHKVYPTFGVGISYDITPNVPVDIAWNRIQKVGNSNNNYPNSTDFFSIGVAYNFG